MKVNDPGYEEGMVSCPPPSAFIREQDIDVFQIDSDDDDDEVEGDVEMQSPSNSVEAELHALKSGSTNNSDHCDGNNRESRHESPHDHHDEFSHILYTTPVDVDYAEATIVAPADLPEGSIMRVYMGMHRIIVVEVVSTMAGNCSVRSIAEVVSDAVDAQFLIWCLIAEAPAHYVHY